MSLIETIKADISNFFSSNPIGKAIESDAKVAWDELLTVGENDLKQVVEQMGTAILTVLASGGASNPQALAAAAIAAGIDAAVVGFKSAGKDITTQTLSTLATTVVNQVSNKVTPSSTGG
jgi:hypothetical protein